MSNCQKTARALAPAIAIAAALTCGSLATANAASMTGTIAFRYYVTDGGPGGNNSNVIAIDSFEIRAAGAVTPKLSEDFARLPGFASATKGWTQKNNSTAPGDEPNWVQGEDGWPYTAHSGAADSYLTVNYQSVADVSGGPETISNWLFSPTMTFNEGDVVSFVTKTDSRTESMGFFPDRLQLLFSPVGGTNVGTGPEDTGTFIVLLDINPTLAPQGYPTVWTQYSAVVPEPAVYLMMALGLGVIGLRRMRAMRN